MSPQDIWQKQQKDAPRVTLEYVRHRAEELTGGNRSKIRRLLVHQSVLSLFLLWEIFSRYAGKPLMQAVTALSVAAVWIWLARWHRNTKPAPFDPQIGVRDSLQYYRGELVRLRDAHANNWRESLLINALLLPLLATAYVVEMHHSWMFIGAIGAFTAVLLPLALLNFARIKRRLQLEIDAVDLLRAP